MDFKTIKGILKGKGFLYMAFRVFYEFRRRSGLMRFSFPTSLKGGGHFSLGDFRNDNSFFFESRETFCLPKNPTDTLREKAERILKGDVPFFSHTWFSLGSEYDWITNPSTGYKYGIHQHWTKVNDFSHEAGDIKFVWEKSRFSWLLTICRYDYHFEEDHAEFAIGQILDWIEKNPLNCGPNYKCSQEISIRILNWLFALYFYRKSETLTEDKWNTIITSIYWQTDHVMKNINFSRIAVRNNHAITETLTLYLMGLMFPMMKKAGLWKRKGKKWFEQEIEYQIEDDGTFIQDSMNYHRVVIQLLTYAIALADKHGEKFSDTVYEKAYKSINFLYQCQEPTNGWLPNYGNNDGALFFPLTDFDYRDYRPQLDALHGLLTGKPLYGDYLEEALWLNVGVPSFRKAYPKVERQYGLVAFENSGYYLIREKDSLTFIRCGLFKHNGSRDQLHMDIWYKGSNVLMDGGSYMYNTDEETVRYFAGTESQNTIMIGASDQMQKGSRFMWFYPPTVLYAKENEEQSYYKFVGKIKAFKQLGGGGVIICREIKKIKDCAEWIVTDTIKSAPVNVLRRQLWHTEGGIQIESDGTIKVNEGWVSEYYGEKRSIKQIEVQTFSDRIETKVSIKE